MRFRYYYLGLSAEHQVLYDASDAIDTVPIPDGEDFVAWVEGIREGLAAESQAAVQASCQGLLDVLSDRFGVPRPRVQIHQARPRDADSELHGCYRAGSDGGRLEVWMRTAVQRRVVRFRTFMRTLAHEYCHHLDHAIHHWGYSFHTEGFFKRESHLVDQLAGPPAPRPAASLPLPASADGAAVAARHG